MPISSVGAELAGKVYPINRHKSKSAMWAPILIIAAFGLKFLFMIKFFFKTIPS
jgi:hypothetical protein